MERSALRSPCHTRDLHLGQTNGSQWRSHGVANATTAGAGEPRAPPASDSEQRHRASRAVPGVATDLSGTSSRMGRISAN